MQIIAKTRCANTIAENIIKPSFEIFMKTMLQQDPVNVLKELLLSNDSIQRRINKMTSDVESQLIEKLKTSKFSIQLDGSTVSDNRAMLMAYVHFIDDSCKLSEEMLFAKLSETDATGLSIFEATKSWSDKNQIPF